MKNKELKKIQHYVNYHVKRANNNILNDNLWNGRFLVKQVERIDRRYEDCSGYYCNFYFEFVDLKTGQKGEFFDWHIHNDSIFFPAHLFEALNNFIVNDCKVWELDNPRKDKTIYRTK